MTNNAPGILNWSAASSALQLNPASEVLPTRAECPQCRKPGLLVYCTTVKETWHCCPECNFSGGLLDLYAAGWGLSKPETLQRLVSDGLLEAGSETKSLTSWEYYTKRREKYLKLWRAASRSENLTRRYLHHYCALHPTVTSPLWADTIGRVCGAISGYDFLLAKVRKLKGTLRPTTALILPFFTRPKQLCGFLALRNKTTAEEPTYSATGGDPISFRSLYRSSGFFALDTVLESRSQRIVVLTDPIRALSLHIRHAATSKTPLPVTSVYWNEKQRVRSREMDWHALADREVYHVCFEFDSRILAMASWSGGKVLYVPIEAAKDRRDWFVRHKPLATTELIFDAAEPWPAVFTKIAAKLDDTELLKLWQEAVVHGMCRDSLRSIPPRLSQRISRLLDGTDGLRAWKLTRSCYVFKRNAQYYVRVLNKRSETEYLVLDADIRVRTLEQSGDDDFICRGELIHRDLKPVEFAVKLKTWETDFANWLRTFTVKHRMGYVYFAPSWQDRIVRVIMAFHPPYQATRREARQRGEQANSSSSLPHSDTISPICEDQGVQTANRQPEGVHAVPQFEVPQE